MLPILEKRIRIMTICARLELVAFLVGMVSLGCFLTGFFAEGIWIPFAILTMICFSIIAGCTLYPKQLSEKSDLRQDKTHQHRLVEVQQDLKGDSK